MRSLKELLQLMLDSEKLFHDNRCWGLCVLAHRLYCCGQITPSERDKIWEYISTHRPKFLSKHWSFRGNSAYYWKKRQWAPRAAWLKTQIKRLP